MTPERVSLSLRKGKERQAGSRGGWGGCCGCESLSRRGRTPQEPMTLSAGWTETFCAECSAFLSLPLGHHFSPQALTTKSSPPTQMPQEEPTGRLGRVWGPGELGEPAPNNSQ